MKKGKTTNNLEIDEEDLGKLGGFDIAKLNEVDIEALLQCLFILACTWSFGGSLDQKGRDMFNDMWRNFITDGSSPRKPRRSRSSAVKADPLFQSASCRMSTPLLFFVLSGAK